MLIKVRICDPESGGEVSRKKSAAMVSLGRYDHIFIIKTGVENIFFDKSGFSNSDMLVWKVIFENSQQPESRDGPEFSPGEQQSSALFRL